MQLQYLLSLPWRTSSPGARDLEKYGITDARLPLTERDDQIRPTQKPPTETGCVQMVC